MTDETQEQKPEDVVDENSGEKEEAAE